MFSDFGPSFFGYGNPGRFRQGAPSPQQFGRQVDRGFGSPGDMTDFDPINFLGMGGMMPSFPSFAGPPTTAMGTQAGVGDPGEGRVNPLWVDVFEAPNHFRLVADVPGVRKENVKINLQRNNILCIQADRMFPRPDEEQQILSCERDYGRYRRHLRLPADCDRDKMQAKCLDGQLIITIPRRSPGQIEEEHLPEQHVSVPLRDKSVEQPREQEQPISPLSQQRQFDQPQQQQQQGQVPSILGLGLPISQKEKEIEKAKEHPAQQWQKEKEKEYPTQQQQEKEPINLGISEVNVSGTGRPSADLLSDAGSGRAPTVMPQQQVQQQQQQPQVPQVQPREEKRDFERAADKEPYTSSVSAISAVQPSSSEFGVSRDKPDLPYRKEKEDYEREQTRQPVRPLEREREQIQPHKITDKESEPSHGQVQGQEKPSLMEKFKGALGLGQKEREREKEPISSYTATPQVLGKEKDQLPLGYKEREQQYPSTSSYGRDQEPKITEKLFGKEQEPTGYGQVQGQGQVQEKPSLMEKVKGALGIEREREKEPISSYTATPQVLGKEKDQLPLGFKEREKEKISPVSISTTGTSVPQQQGKGFEQGQEQQFKQYPTQYPSTSSYGRDQEEMRGWDREREREKPSQPSTGVSSMLPLPQQQKWESQGQGQGPAEIHTQTQQQEGFGVPTSVGDLSQGMQQRETSGRAVPESQQQQQWSGDRERQPQQKQAPSPAGTQRRAARDIPVTLGIYHHSI